MEQEKYRTCFCSYKDEKETNIFSMKSNFIQQAVMFSGSQLDSMGLKKFNRETKKY